MHKLVAVVERVLAWILIVLMGFSVLNVLWQVFTRFILDNPSSYTEELARYLLVWIGVLAAAYGVGTRSHLAIDLLPLKLTGKKRQWLEIFIQACVAAFAVTVLIIGGSRLVGITLHLQQTSAALGVKLGHVYVVLPAAGVIVLLFSLSQLIDAVRGHVPGDEELEASESHPID